MRSLRTLERRLVAFEKTVLAVFVVLLVSLGFLQVVLRGFERGFLWVDAFLRYLVLWIGFFGACIATADDKHFAMDAAARALGPRAKSAVRAVSHALAAAVCGLMAFASWRFLGYEREAGSAVFTLAGTPVKGWVLETILPAGFLLLAVHSVLRMALKKEETGP